MSAPYTVSLVGGFNAGKSSLARTLVEGTWTSGARDEKDYDKWYTDEVVPVTLTVDGKERAVQVLDTGRHETGGRMDMSEYYIPMKFYNANALLLCVNLASEHALDYTLKNWLPLAQHSAEPAGVPIFLVGLRSDERATEKGVPSREDIEKRANECGIAAYFECSAKLNEGISDLFEAVVRELDSYSAEHKGKVPVIKPLSEKERERAYYRSQGLDVGPDADAQPAAQEKKKPEKKQKKTVKKEVVVAKKSPLTVDQPSQQQAGTVGGSSKKGDCNIL